MTSPRNSWPATWSSLVPDHSKHWPLRVHSRPDRASGRSDYVRYAAKAEVSSEVSGGDGDLTGLDALAVGRDLDLGRELDVPARGAAVPGAGKGRSRKTRRSQRGQETWGFSDERLRQARAVLRFSREYALAVRDGSKKLDDVAHVGIRDRAVRRADAGAGGDCGGVIARYGTT